MSISKTVTTMLRHFDQDERESDRDIGRQTKSMLLRFERDGVQDFNDEVWLQRSLKAAQRQEWSTVKTKMEFYVIYERFNGILEVFQSTQNRWVMYLSLVIGRDTYSTEDFHGTFSSPTNPSRKRGLMTTSQFHRKHFMFRNGSMTRMQKTGYD